jgi:hypothetical protein
MMVLIRLFSHDFLMESEEGAKGEGELARAARKRKPEEQEEWLRITQSKLLADRERTRAEETEGREAQLVLDNERLRNRNAILERENLSAQRDRLDYLEIKDENERLEAALELTGLVSQVKRLESKLAAAESELCYANGDLVRANANLYAIRRGVAPPH